MYSTSLPIGVLRSVRSSGCRPIRTRRAGKLIAGTVIYRQSGQKGAWVGVAMGDFEDLVRRYRRELHVH